MSVLHGHTRLFCHAFECKYCFISLVATVRTELKGKLIIACSVVLSQQILYSHTLYLRWTFFSGKNWNQTQEHYRKIIRSAEKNKPTEQPANICRVMCNVLHSSLDLLYSNGISNASKKPNWDYFMVNITYMAKSTRKTESHTQICASLTNFIFKF